MDIITQLALGAAVGEAVLGKKLGNKAPLWGMLGGLIPDLDVLANFVLQEPEKLAFHRSYSHSLLFAVLGGLFFGFLWWIIYFNKQTAISRKQEIDAIIQDKPYIKSNQIFFKDWFYLFFLTFLTHIALDTFTTYGTQILMPFDNFRLEIGSISIVDPLYTLPLILATLIATFIAHNKKSRKIINNIGLILSSAYLIFTVSNKMYVNYVFKESLKAQDIEYKRLFTNPTLLNNALWYGAAECDSGYHIGFYSIFDNHKTIHFNFEPNNRHLWQGVDTTYAINTLKWFSNNYYILAKEDNELLYIDIRFGKMDITSTDPLNSYIFYFEVFRDQNGNITFEQRQKRPTQNITELFTKLIVRVKGN